MISPFSSYRHRPSKTLCIMASVSEAADCPGSKLSGSEPMFIRTTVSSPLDWLVRED